MRGGGAGYFEAFPTSTQQHPELLVRTSDFGPPRVESNRAFRIDRRGFVEGLTTVGFEILNEFLLDLSPNRLVDEDLKLVHGDIGDFRTRGGRGRISRQRTEPPTTRGLRGREG